MYPHNSKNKRYPVVNKLSGVLTLFKSVWVGNPSAKGCCLKVLFAHKKYLLTAKKYLLAAVALVAGVLLSGSGCGFAEVIMRQQWGPRNRLSTEQLLFMGGL